MFVLLIWLWKVFVFICTVWRQVSLSSDGLSWPSALKSFEKKWRKKNVKRNKNENKVCGEQKAILRWWGCCFLYGEEDGPQGDSFRTDEEDHFFFSYKSVQGRSRWQYKTVTLLSAPRLCRKFSWLAGSPLGLVLFYSPLWNNWARLHCKNSCAIFHIGKWKGKRLEWHVAPDHQAFLTSLHAHTHWADCVTFIMSTSSRICGNMGNSRPGKCYVRYRPGFRALCTRSHLQTFIWSLNLKK